MGNFIKHLSYLISELREKALVSKLSRTLGLNLSNSTSKTIISATETMTFTSVTDKKREEVLENVTSIMLSAKGNPDKLIAYMKSSGVEVYTVADNSKVLKSINEEYGMILPIFGVRALALNLFLKRAFSFKTPVLLILTQELYDFYFILQQFYKWYSYKSGLPGFDSKTQRIFKKYMTSSFNINSLSLEETLLLKEAVARDSEATDFAIEIAKLKDGGRNVLNKMKDGGANI